MGTIKKRFGYIHIQKIRAYMQHLTLEQILSAICFLAALAFLAAALMGTWRYFITMILCITVGIMISGEDTPTKRS